jgi:aspartate ammonia-lyase
VATKCIDDIDANVQHLREVVESGEIIATSLNPVLGYDKVAEIVKEARKTGKTVRRVVLDAGLMSEMELDKALDVEWMTKGGLEQP